MADLGKLFSKAPEKNTEIKHPRRVTKWIHYSKLIRSSYQFYDEETEEIKTLAMLIKMDGEVLQNLIVRKLDADEYEIVAGHKRTLACKYLVEEEGLEAFAFLPCDVKQLKDIRAQFQVMSSNYHHTKSDYEKMKEISDMKYIMENYPEEFPDVLAGGRVVEHLAKQLGMKKSTVSEYLSIDHNLIEEGKELLEKNEINKSSAVALASLPAGEQKTLIDHGSTSLKEIKKHKEVLEPSDDEISVFYNIYMKEKYRLDDPELKSRAVKDFGKSYTGGFGGKLDFSASPSKLIINQKEITWSRFINRLKKICGRQEIREDSQKNIPDSKEEIGVDLGKPDHNLAASSVEEQLPGQMSVRDYPEIVPETMKNLPEVSLSNEVKRDYKISKASFLEDLQQLIHILEKQDIYLDETEYFEYLGHIRAVTCLINERWNEL